MAIDRVRVNEESTKVIEFDILDEDDEGVPATSLATATLTLYDMDTFTSDVSPDEGIINSRDGQNVLNTNDVAIDSEGHVIWTMDPDDNPIVTERRQVERHRALFLFTWSGGQFKQEIEIEVVNLRGAA